MPAPILLFGAAALSGYHMTSYCLSAIFGGAAYNIYRERQEAYDRECVDVNAAFEKRFAEKMRATFGTPKHKDEDKAHRLGVGDLGETVIPKEALPEQYQRFAGPWYVSKKDEVILYYFLLRVQSKYSHGQTGHLLDRLAEKSDMTRSHLDDLLFGVDAIDSSLDQLVETIQEMSKNRYANKNLAHALAESKKAQGA